MRKRWNLLAVLFGCVFALSLTGCADKGAEEEKTEQTETAEADEDETDEEDSDSDEEESEWEYIVDTSYVKEHIGDNDVLFVDARGSKSALVGTVEGAIATTWQDLCTCQEGKPGDKDWGKIPDPEDLEERLGKLGITKEKEIILIGETSTGWGDDARILWELVAAGYDDVKMVDGGYEAIKRDDVERQHGASKPVAGEVTIDEIDNTHVMTTEELQKNYDQYKIVDVRTDEEYDGAVLYDEAKGGHMPGAVHIRYTDLFREDGTLKSQSDIEAMFTEAGITKEDQIVAYCTGGIRSAYMQLVLEMCGYEHTWNYDQSFWRWAVVGDVE